MNGIVHPCSHPEDRPAPETEEEMMLEVFRYTDRVVNMVRPRKLLMIAVGMWPLYFLQMRTGLKEFLLTGECCNRRCRSPRQNEPAALASFSFRPGSCRKGR